MVLCAALVFAVPTAQAQTDDVASMLAMIQQLQERVAQLQEQLRTTRGELQEVRQEIRQTLREGMRGEEVEKLQELLASDPEIYPEALTTGYFGNLTRSALARLQARHGVPQSGELDEATRELINEYFAERTGRADAPEGLLRAPGIQEAIERRVCERGVGNRPFCPSVTDTEYREYPEDAEEDKVKDEEQEEVDVTTWQQEARQAIAGAERGIEYVQEAVRNVPRNVNTTQIRRTLIEAQTELRTAQRAYRAEEYGIAYESAVTARQLAARALDLLPERALERERVREAVDRFEKLEREREQDKDDKKDDKKDDILRTCGLEEFKQLVGEADIDRDEVIATWEEYHDSDADVRSVRFLNPGDAMTMDYIETRLNVFFDEDGVVEKVTCG